jgi:hypothetical protein
MRTPVRIVLLVACLGAACSRGGKHALVGKWQSFTGSTIEFRANGTLALQKEGRTREARYRMPNPTQIEFLPPDRDEPYDRWEVLSLNATTLRAKNSKGSEQSLTRAP